MSYRRTGKEDPIVVKNTVNSGRQGPAWERPLKDSLLSGVGYYLRLRFHQGIGTLNRDICVERIVALGKQPSSTNSDENPGAKAGWMPTDWTLHGTELRETAVGRENRLWLLWWVLRPWTGLAWKLEEKERKRWGTGVMYCLENDSWDSAVLLLGKTEVLLGTNWDSESQCKRLDVTAGPGNSANRKEEQGCGDTLGGGLEGFSGKKKK